MGVGAYARRHLPPDDARLLQGLPVPRLGQRDSRHAPRAGHAQDGRAAHATCRHVLDVPDRRPSRSPASPPFAGFFSKDEILWKAFSTARAAGALGRSGSSGAGLTAFYMFRQVFLTFLRREPRRPAHAASICTSRRRSMTVPLVVLAVLARVWPATWAVPAALGGANRFEQWLAPVFAHGAHAAGARGRPCTAQATPSSGC